MKPTKHFIAQAQSISNALAHVPNIQILPEFDSRMVRIVDKNSPLLDDEARNAARPSADLERAAEILRGLGLDFGFHKTYMPTKRPGFTNDRPFKTCIEVSL